MAGVRSRARALLNWDSQCDVSGPAGHQPSHGVAMGNDRKSFRQRVRILTDVRSIASRTTLQGFQTGMTGTGLGSKLLGMAKSKRSRPKKWPASSV